MRMLVWSSPLQVKNPPEHMIIYFMSYDNEKQLILALGFLKFEPFTKSSRHSHLFLFTTTMSAMFEWNGFAEHDSLCSAVDLNSIDLDSKP